MKWKIFKQRGHKAKNDCSNIDQNFFVFPRSCSQAKNGFQQHPVDPLEFFKRKPGDFVLKLDFQPIVH